MGVVWALGGKRVQKQWATALRAYDAWCVSTGTPPGLPPELGAGQFRMCEFIYELGMVRGLRVVTVRKYVGAVHSWWRAVDPRLAPGVKEGGLSKLAIARYAEFDRRLPQQFQKVDPVLLRAVLECTDPSKTTKEAVLFGFFNTARTGEYVQAEHSVDWHRNLVRWGQLRFTDAPGAPRTIDVTFETRKNNTSSMGAEQRLHHVELVENKELCFVSAMFEMRDEWRAAGLADPAPDAPIFRRPDGSPLQASDVAEALRAGAVRLGRPTERLSAYALRIGAATQLKRAGVDEVLIMLAGGWASAAGMRGYCRNVPEDHAWLGAVLVDENPTARAAAARAAAAPAVAGVKRGRAGGPVR